MEKIVERDLELSLRRNRVITPSNISPWFGTWEGDAVYTLQQIAIVKAMGKDIDALDHIDVRVPVSDRDVWAPLGTKMVHLVRCPVIQRRPSDGRLKVITPIGDAKLVWPDGRIRKPKRRY